MRGFLFALISLCFAPAVALTQAAPQTCPAIITQVLQTVDAACADAERNQACYGNVNVTVEPTTGATNVQFKQMGDIINVSDIDTLRLSGMDTENGVWGVALMRLQANLPNTLPGQNVTFLLFGDVTITNEATAGNTPMQAFTLSTGTGEPQCNEAPEDGVLVQTPQGVGQVNFSVNGVDVAMGSTVYLQARPNDNMRISTLEGSAAIRTEEAVYPVIAGSWATFPVDEDLNIIDPPTIAAYEDFPEFDFTVLPLDLLPDEFEPEDDLSTDDLEDILDYWEKTGVLCGEGSPFDCDANTIIDLLGGDLCALDDDGDFDCELDWDDFDDEDIYNEDLGIIDDDDDFADDDFADDDFSDNGDDDDFADDDFADDDFSDNGDDDDFSDDDFADDDFSDNGDDDDFSDDGDDDDD